MSGLSKTF